MKNKQVLLTGGSGSFGFTIFQKLIVENIPISLLMRPESINKTRQKISSLFSPVMLTRISFIPCDLTQRNFGLPLGQYQQLTDQTTHIIHAAAVTRFNLPLEIIRNINVVSTENMIYFAKKCKKLIRFGYISTAFVAGKRRGRIMEDEFSSNSGFLNTYQQSKYESEYIIRQELNLLPVVIFRPTLIFSKQISGNKKPINALSLTLFFAQKRILPVLPGEPDTGIDIITPEYAACSIMALFNKDTLKSNIFHISGGDNLIKITEIISLLEKHACRKLSITWIPVSTYKVDIEKRFKRRPDLQILYHKLNYFLPELGYPKIFDHSNVTKELGKQVNNTKALLNDIKSTLL